MWRGDALRSMRNVGRVRFLLFVQLRGPAMLKAVFLLSATATLAGQLYLARTAMAYSDSIDLDATYTLVVTIDGERYAIDSGLSAEDCTSEADSASTFVSERARVEIIPPHALRECIAE
jgi:hypothetical protein